MPPIFDGVNWAAFLLGGVWALLHGVWSWFAAILIVRFGLIALGVFASRAGLFDAGVSEQAFSIVGGLLSWGLYSVFALNANRLAWDKARSRLGRRLDSVPGSQTTVGAYVRNQKTLLFLGVALLALGIALQAQSAIQRSAGLASFVIAVGVVALLAVVTRLVDVARRGKQ